MGTRFYTKPLIQLNEFNKGLPQLSSLSPQYPKTTQAYKPLTTYNVHMHIGLLNACTRYSYMFKSSAINDENSFNV